MESKFDHSCCIYCQEELKDCTKCFTIDVDLVNYLDDSEEAKTHHFHLKPHSVIQLDKIKGKEPVEGCIHSGRITGGYDKLYIQDELCCPKYSICRDCLTKDREDVFTDEPTGYKGTRLVLQLRKTHSSDVYNYVQGFPCLLGSHFAYDEHFLDNSFIRFDIKTEQQKPYSVPELRVFKDLYFEPQKYTASQQIQMFMEVYAKANSKDAADILKPETKQLLELNRLQFQRYSFQKRLIEKPSSTAYEFSLFKYETLLIVNQYIANPDAWVLYQQEKDAKHQKWLKERDESIKQGKEEREAMKIKLAEKLAQMKAAIALKKQNKPQ